MRHHKEKMKIQYDKKIHPVEYEVGQRVWLYFPSRKVGEIKKFHRKYDGPFIITHRVYEKNYKLVRAYNLKPLKNMVYVDRLKPYVSRDVKPPIDEELEEALGAGHDDDDNDDNLSDLEQDDLEEDIVDVEAHILDTQPSQEVEETANGQPGPPKDPAQEASQAEAEGQVEMESSSEGSPVDGRGQTSMGVSEPPNDQTVNLRRSKRLKEQGLRTINYNENDNESESDGEKEYEVNRIIKGRYNKNGEFEYLIDWKGFPPEA